MSNPLQLRLHRFGTPIGEMLVAFDAEDCIWAVDWAEWEERTRAHLRKLHPAVEIGQAGGKGRAVDAFRRYFAGEISALDDLRVHSSGTDFQQSVWRLLRDIPGGTTVSYGDLAKRLGKPAAVRAVGLANGANPIPIVVPCHRVIGADGSLTGYGGGIERKRWLLAHEGVLLI